MSPGMEAPYTCYLYITHLTLSTETMFFRQQPLLAGSYCTGVYISQLYLNSHQIFSLESSSVCSLISNCLPIYVKLHARDTYMLFSLKKYTIHSIIEVQNIAFESPSDEGVRKVSQVNLTSNDAERLRTSSSNSFFINFCNIYDLCSNFQIQQHHH